mmetsp:Transcript_42538/g.166049  ORF Transcript_42538/g.166049 Transcript_42538/m.166049 type:complete len:80 (-) Transcript_42538:4892-5131(-)
MRGIHTRFQHGAKYFVSGVAERVSPIHTCVIQPEMSPMTSGSKPFVFSFNRTTEISFLNAEEPVDIAQPEEPPPALVSR